MKLTRPDTRYGKLMFYFLAGFATPTLTVASEVVCNELLTSGQASTEKRAERNAHLKMLEKLKDLEIRIQDVQVLTQCEQKWLWRCKSKANLCDVKDNDEN